MNDVHRFSFKELLEKRESMMREKDAYIEIPLETIEEEKEKTHFNKSTNTIDIYDKPTVVQNKTKKKWCKYLFFFVGVTGLIAVNDYLLITFFV